MEREREMGDITKRERTRDGGIKKRERGRERWGDNEEGESER